nr:reverse transcriptase domain-containing protein [Tanacetum cinerariifolium]
MPADCLKIIESKSKVCQPRAKAVIAKVSSNYSTPAVSADVAELKDMVRALLLDMKNQYSAQTSAPTPTPIKAVELNYDTCDGNHVYQNCPATSGNVYQDNIQEYVSQAAAANYSQGNTGFRPQMVANQIRPPGFPSVQNTQNNFNRGNNFNQNRGGNFNQSNINQSQLNRPQVNQPLAYQAPAYQAPVFQTQSVSQNDFERYIKANDAVLRNIQNQGQSIQNQCQSIQNQLQTVQNQLANLTDMMAKFMSANTASSSGSRTLPGNTVTNPKEDLKGTLPEVVLPIKDPLLLLHLKLQTKEPSAPMPNLKPSIPYPSRRDTERRHCSVFKPVGIAKDVKVKVGMFHFPANFVVVNFELDPRVPLIFERCFLKTSRALIDVHKGELTLQIGNEAITYNLDQPSRYSANYDQMMANKIDVTDKACEE